MNWRHPGRIGAALYAIAAVGFGGLVTVVTRLRMAKGRGRRRAVEHLPDGPIIVICNHASYADGVLLALVCRRMGRSVRLLASSGIFRAPLLGRLITRLGFIPVERDSSRAGESLRPAIEALAAGEAIGIFPEGRTTRDPDRWPERAKTGAVRLALLSGAPIVPIAMVGTHRVLGREHPIRSIIKNLVLRPKVLVDVGEPIDLRALAAGEATDPDEIRELADEVMRRLVELVAGLRGEVAPHPSGVERGSTDESDVRPSRW